MFSPVRVLAAAATLLVSQAVSADATTQAIEAALKQSMPTLKPESITPSKMPGLYEVIVGPKLFYTSADGKYVIQGSLIDVAAQEDLTEPRLMGARIAALKKVGDNKMITFKPKSHKYDLYVFTDIDCGYCRKLHSEIDQYLNEGIAVHYLFFPRAGEGSPSWDKAVSVWCAKDRPAALTKAKKGENVESKQCDNPVKEHMELGNALGAQGTPMLVTQKGSVLPGYVPAAQLGKLLARENGTPAAQATAKK
ncbi:MAG: DsbC family protein [Methylococcaceae bacterium]|nr:DsbC family protein [Methylococcaceae bacterium]